MVKPHVALVLNELLQSGVHPPSLLLPVLLLVPQVVRTLNAQREPGLPELPINELEQQNVRKGSDRDPFSADQMHCFDSVSRWYACDIDRFGFAAATQV